MTFPENLKYTKDHEWIKLESDDTAVIGITEFAQSELGDIVYVEIETAGETLSKEEVFGSIEAVKTVSDLFMPVSGEILEVNSALADAPELVNKSAYTDGWLIRIRMNQPSELEELLDATEYSGLVS